MEKTKSIKVDLLARVEGEGGIHIKISNGKVEDLKLRIFEPPRFFEAFLRGRAYYEVVDIVARICGICPVAYQMSAAHAIEKIFGVKVDGQIRELRRLIYCAEWISSHCLHMYFLSAPDFLCFDDALSMGRKYPEILKTALQLKMTGNELLSYLGGRSVHPVSVRVGGFCKIPSKKRLLEFIPELQRGYEKALKAISWAGSLEFPELSCDDMEFVSLWHPDEYPINEGRLHSNRGLDIDAIEFSRFIQEFQEPYSTALPSRIKNRGVYVVGPLSRLNLNHGKLPDEIKSAVKDAGINFPITNIFMSIVARAIEVAYSFHEAIRIIKGYEEPSVSCMQVEPEAGETSWITEAPRGSLYHNYTIDRNGYITACNIIPPTAQNIKSIEESLYRFVSLNIDEPIAELQKKCEMIVRSYDPCISCSTHQLRVKIA